VALFWSGGPVKRILSAAAGTLRCTKRHFGGWRCDGLLAVAHATTDEQSITVKENPGRIVNFALEHQSIINSAMVAKGGKWRDRVVEKGKLQF